MSIYDLPKDILLIIFDNVDSSHGKMSFAMCSKTFYNLFYPILFCRCTTEIEYIWNEMLVPQVTRRRCLNFPNFCSKGCTMTASKKIRCSIFSWKTHSLEVQYFHFPRDVDILSWYENGHKIGYTMF